VIVIASDDQPQARARVLSAGAAAYLLTPVDKHALLNAIATAVASDALESAWSWQG
jgi:DNA-binding NarL/FixJ family response regulator